MMCVTSYLIKPQTARTIFLGGGGKLSPTPYQTLAPVLARTKNGLGPNQTEFYRMVARLMPKEVEAKISSEFTLVDALMEVEDYVKGEK